MPRCYLILLLLGTLVFVWGCRDSEGIRKYRVPKSRSDLGEIGLKKLPEDSAQGAASTPASKPLPARMFVAIAEREQAAWFFKVTGPVEAVDSKEEQWKAILNSVEFNDSGRPDWDLPEGWIVGPPKTMRYATLLSPREDGPVEISVSNLSPNQNLLDNVNRWRVQLGLDSIEKEELELKTIDSKSGEMKVFDATGKLDLSGPMSPAAQTKQPQLPDLKYDVPAGWIAGKPSMMQPVRLRYGTDKDAPLMTVTQLFAGTNKWLPNAQRWAGQVAIQQDEKYIDELTSEIEVDGYTGQKIVLVPDDEELNIGMIGAMVIQDDIAWFFKLIGDKKFVANNQEMFDQFLTGFKF